MWLHEVSKIFKEVLMMKNIKRFTLLAMLAGSIAILMASCSFKMDTKQEAFYNEFIEKLEKSVKDAEIPADTVKFGIDDLNAEIATQALGFKIVDKDAGKPIAKGTKADALKKRFVPKKA